MTQTVCILGRQPALGLAELESLFGSEAVQPIGSHAALIDKDPADIDFSRLGGTVKFAKLLTFIDSTRWNDIADFLNQAVPTHATALPPGKLRLGLSAYGLHVTPKQLLATGLTLKKHLKISGRAVRFVPNKAAALNSAQVLHNQLTDQLGWELLFIADGQRTVCAQSIAVQNIEAYAARDQARPARDAKVGMLPPKLAQIIINLAVGHVMNGERRTANGELGSPYPIIPSSFLVPRSSFAILDPFCGTGVILQEALLMGYTVYGTDLEPRMVNYAKQNLLWLPAQYANQQNCQPGQEPDLTAFHLEVGDAVTHSWQQAFNSVASEVYLGRPFSSQPDPTTLAQVISDVNLIIKKFLKNLAGQTPSSLRICLAVPAWHTPRGFKHLPLLDSLEEIGYTRVSFVHAKEADLIYHRADQIVARELVALVRM